MTIAKVTVPKKPKTAESKKVSVPLIIEQHPVEYDGYPFITLIQYRKQPMLAVVDNIINNLMFVFVLDLCEPTLVNEEMVIRVAHEWYQNNRSNFPVSIEFSQRGLTSQTALIYRALNIEFVSRIIGPAPKYPMSTTKSVKRRRRKALSPGVDINHTRLTTPDLTS